MTAHLRAYDHKRDFAPVGDFLVRTYQAEGRSANWLQPRWEYMHFHPYLDDGALAKIGVWEDAGEIVALATYEHRLGDAYFAFDPAHANLKEALLGPAAEHLYRELGNGRRALRAYISDGDAEFELVAESQGFKKDVHAPEPMSFLAIPSPFPPIELPAGFRLQSLADENDLGKVHRVLHRGFIHSGEPPEEGLPERERMQSTPNFRKDLTIVTVAPSGDYASFGGIWFEAVNQIAYVEPVATDPDYRFMGLGKAVVLEGVRRCGELGATVAYVGSTQAFYLAMGFQRIFALYPWVKYSG